MAVEVEATGQVDEFLRVLRRRIWWIVVPLALIGSIGIFFAVIVPKKYVSNAEVMVRNLGQQAGEFGQKASAIEGQVAPYNIQSPARIDSVLNKLGWSDYRPLSGPEKHDYRLDLLRDLSVELPSMPKDSGRQLVKMQYKDTTKERAVAFLEVLQASWTEEVLNRHLNEQKKEVQETADVMRSNSRRLQEIREEETAIRTENQIPPPLQTPLGREEPRPKAYEQLTFAENRITELELQLQSDTDALELLEEKRDRLPIDAAGEFDESDPITRAIDSVDSKIAAIEVEIDTGGWAPGHSERVKRESAIRGLRKNRVRLVNERSGAGFGGAPAQKNQRRLALTEEIEDLRSKVAADRRKVVDLQRRQVDLRQETQRLNDAFKELDRLDEEKRELSATNASLSPKLADLRIQVGTLDSEQGDPFEVQLAPTTPTKPTSPNPWLIGIGSIVFGLGLGLALAVLLEYSKNCFRSAREISRVMPLPVLGTINTIRTRRERARSFLVRAALGGGSLAFVLGVGFVTWAWALDQGALNDRVVRAIDEFRRILM